jgi:hypothetical protein
MNGVCIIALFDLLCRNATVFIILEHHGTACGMLWRHVIVSAFFKSWMTHDEPMTQSEMTSVSLHSLRLMCGNFGWVYMQSYECFLVYIMAKRVTRSFIVHERPLTHWQRFMSLCVCTGLARSWVLRRWPPLLLKACWETSSTSMCPSTCGLPSKSMGKYVERVLLCKVKL